MCAQHTQPPYVCMWVISSLAQSHKHKTRDHLSVYTVLSPQLPIPQFQLNLTSTSGEIPGIFAVTWNAFLGLWEMI